MGQTGESFGRVSQKSEDIPEKYFLREGKVAFLSWERGCWGG
jgi:hypothetical protein